MTVTRTQPGPRRRPNDQGPRQFVEKLAVALETDGFPRIAGRIFALLIISEEELSLDDISDAVAASKASASVNTRLLQDKGLIDRVSRTGDRRDYYRISSDLFVRTMEQRLSRWDRVRGVVSEAMGDASLPVSARGRLREFDSASEEVTDVLETALVRLRQRRRK